MNRVWILRILMSTSLLSEGCGGSGGATSHRKGGVSGAATGSVGQGNAAPQASSSAGRFEFSWTLAPGEKPPRYRLFVALKGEKAAELVEEVKAEGDVTQAGGRTSLVLSIEGRPVLDVYQGKEVCFTVAAVADLESEPSNLACLKL